MLKFLMRPLKDSWLEAQRIFIYDLRSIECARAVSSASPKVSTISNKPLTRWHLGREAALTTTSYLHGTLKGREWMIDWDLQSNMV
jgi:hypothetical protein